jgi:hypothetical protein
MSAWRRNAWIAIVIADLGMLAWGAMAALAPDHLLGPGSSPILAAGYEGFTGASWGELARGPRNGAEFIGLLFRTYGAFGVAFSVLAIAIAATAFRRGEAWAWWALLVGNTISFIAAMTYDRITGAIGPFEMSEYIGLTLIYGALALNAPFKRRAPLPT